MESASAVDPGSMGKAPAFPVRGTLAPAGVLKPKVHNQCPEHPGKPVAAPSILDCR